MSSFDNAASWWGVGVKGGGSIGPGGFETTEGVISNLLMPSHSHSINISSLRIGPGLGAGGGLCVIYVFNCRNPQNLHQKNDSSWSINFALGAKWSDAVKFLARSKVFSVAPRLVKGIAAASRHDLDGIRNGASYLYTLFELKDLDKDKVVVIDVPFAGVGLELSGHMLYGTIFIGDLRMNSRVTDRVGIPSGGKRMGEM